MRSLRGERVATERGRNTGVRRCILPKQLLVEEHLSEGEPADAARGLKQKIASRPELFHFYHLVYRNSLRFSMTLVKSTSEPDWIMSVANESSLFVGDRVSAIR